MIGLLISTAVSLQIVPFIDQPEKIRVVARELEDTARAKISLHLVIDGKPGPAMFGSSKVSGEMLIFYPAMKLSRGKLYEARLQTAVGQILKESYQAPNAAAPPPRLTAIYPTSPELPANLLKFYLYFSEPMREGTNIFDQIHLESADGKRVHAPWRRQELWNEDATRLTLWIHPGRIKRGVNLREELGPVLKPEENYTLIIDEAVQSAAGEPLPTTQHHRFKTIDEDFARPDLTSWLMQTPVRGSKSPLVVFSPEPLDHALLQRHLEIQDAAGQRVPTEIEVNQREKVWSMIPLIPWKAETYRLQVGTNLEDLAGNTPNRVFDRDLNQRRGPLSPEFLEFTPF